MTLLKTYPLQLIADDPKLQISVMISVKNFPLKSTDTVNITRQTLAEPPAKMT
jgi:hypothetical protein